MRICVKKIEGVTLPAKGSPVAAGYDIIATSDPKIVGEPSGFEDSAQTCWKRIDYLEYETSLFIAPTVIMAHTLIYPRSSISKLNLVLANSIGLVDNDYRGMIVCRFKYIWQPEDSRVGTPGGQLTFKGGVINVDKIYKKGDKIAQLVFEPTTQVDFTFVDVLDITTRGAGGFGSTDKILSGPTSGPANFNDPPSAMADRYRKLNYVASPQSPYQQSVKEAQQNCQ